MVEEQHASPEELAAVTQQQCIFCHIANGRVASRKVYEDSNVVAILDINPANPGHVLIIPKEHYVIMPQIPEEILQHIGMVAKGISHAQLRALKVQGTNIFAANGIVAGQRAQHFMLHVIPRVEGDQISFALPERSISSSDAKTIQNALKKTLAKSMGLKVEEETEEKQAQKEPEKTEEEKEKAEEEKQAPKKAGKTKQKDKKTPAAKPVSTANLDEITRLLAGEK